MPYNYELHPNLSKAPEPWLGNSGDQEAAYGEVNLEHQ